MSSGATTFNMDYLGNSAAATAPRWGIYSLSRYPYLFQKIVDAIFDPEMYEDGRIRPPSLPAVIRAANVLGDAVPPAYLHDIQIDSHLGDINVTWRNRQVHKRTKITFVRDSDVVLLYHEQTERGRIAESDMVPHATNRDIGRRVDWLYE